MCQGLSHGETGPVDGCGLRGKPRCLRCESKSGCGVDGVSVTQRLGKGKTSRLSWDVGSFRLPWATKGLSGAVGDRLGLSRVP